MELFEALDYQRPISSLYKLHLKTQTRNWTRVCAYLVAALIALVVGGIHFLLRQTIDWLTVRKWALAHAVFTSGTQLPWALTATVSVACSLALTAAAALLCVWLAPHAAGSGIPEVMAYLNGVLLPKVFNIKTLCVKWASCVLAVASGLPMGPEGPMIHLGAAVGLPPPPPLPCPRPPLPRVWAVARFGNVGQRDRPVAAGSTQIRSFTRNVARLWEPGGRGGQWGMMHGAPPPPSLPRGAIPSRPVTTKTWCRRSCFKIENGRKQFSIVFPPCGPVGTSDTHTCHGICGTYDS